MRIVFAVTFVLAAQCFSATIATAVEGPTAAGPLGGNDIRSALLPPPGTYIGTFAGWAEATAIIDGDGREIDAYRGAKLNRGLFAPFVAYVPSWQVAGGRVALSAVLPMGQSCGHLVPAARTECLSAVGDVYVEADWSIGFGHWRASADPTASPLFEGLTLLVGLGVVIPTGA
ncbi:MAG: hypothetical protein ABL907_08050, partial [Hyphomicrobium sp.]